MTARRLMRFPRKLMGQWHRELAGVIFTGFPLVAALVMAELAGCP